MLFSSEKISPPTKPVYVLNLDKVAVTYFLYCFIWASTQENLSLGVCKQQRRRPACTSMQSDQCLCCSIFGNVYVKIATSEISIFYLVSVAEETGLGHALSETPKTGFVEGRPTCILLQLSGMMITSIQPLSC